MPTTVTAPPATVSHTIPPVADPVAAATAGEIATRGRTTTATKEAKR